MSRSLSKHLGKPVSYAAVWQWWKNDRIPQYYKPAIEAIAKKQAVTLPVDAFPDGTKAA